MALRKGHGKGRGSPRIEVLPVDELPGGVPAPARPESPTDRGVGGRFAAGNALARLGGRARQGATRLASRTGLSDVPDAEAFAPYRKAAVSFRRAQCTELARTVGGGVCGPGPSSIVASAAMQLAFARFIGDQAAALGDGEAALKASRLMDASRQSLLAAHELCAREAKARLGEQDEPDAVAEIRALARSGA